MGGVTDAVRQAIKELGPDASDKEVRAYLRKNRPDVPQSQVSLTLRTVRGEVHRASNRSGIENDQDSLWSE